jgi:hypothetical protein
MAEWEESAITSIVGLMSAQFAPVGAIARPPLSARRIAVLLHSQSNAVTNSMRFISSDPFLFSSALPRRGARRKTAPMLLRVLWDSLFLDKVGLRVEQLTLHRVGVTSYMNSIYKHFANLRSVSPVLVFD